MKDVYRQSRFGGLSTDSAEAAHQALMIQSFLRQGCAVGARHQKQRTSRMETVLRAAIEWTPCSIKGQNN